MLKAAVIGVGAMGRNHARVYAELDGVQLVGVADSNQDLANDAADKYRVKSYASYQDMLAAENPEVVSVAVPTAMHEEVGTAVLQAGAHILIEKPIASTVDEGKRLMALAEKVDTQADQSATLCASTQPSAHCAKSSKPASLAASSRSFAAESAHFRPVSAT